jgi:serine/threonine protein kinase
MVEPRRGNRANALDDTAEIGIATPKQRLSIGRFQVVRLIASGTYTSIFEIAECGQRFALKTLNTGQEEHAVQRFEQCAAIVASLGHPNVLPCLETGRLDGLPYAVMPFADAGSLHELVTRQVLPRQVEVIQIIRAVGSALDYAHERGVVHGFVHTRHVILGANDQVWVAGFGEVSGEFPVRIFLGNPRHLSPEQCESLGNAVPQSDVYALAEVAYMLLSGHHPFEGTSSYELLVQKRSGPVPSIRERAPRVPQAADLVLQRAMTIRPQDRIRSAGQFVEQLDNALRRTD